MPGPGSRSRPPRSRLSLPRHVGERERLGGLPAVRVPARVDGSAREPPLVLVPGLNDPLHSPADSRWYPVAVARYCRRYAARRPVYYVGQPRDPDRETVAAIAAAYEPAVAAVADRHGPPALLGLSMGGFLAGEVAATRPDLVDGLVLGLAADRVDRPDGRDLLRRWDDHAAAGRFLPVYREASDVVARGATRLAMRAVAVVYDRVRSPSAPAAFRRALSACLDYDGGETLRAVADADPAVPTLVVGGDRDPFFTDEGFARAARLADGRRARLRGAGHEALLAGDAFARVVRRFTRTPARGPRGRR